MLYAQLYILFLAAVFGARDGINYSIYGVPKTDYKTLHASLKWWHFSGAFLYGFAGGPLVMIISWKLIIALLLLRVSIFDIAYNHFAGLPLSHIGTEAFWDRVFRSIFGAKGGIIKAVCFVLILALLNFLNIRYAH